MDASGRLEAIIGYYNLELFEEALEEMAALPGEVRTRPELRAMETAILIRQKDWKAALALSRQLCLELPDQPSPWLDTAYCLHELGHTSDARDFLLQGPPVLKNQAVYYYNLACYEAQMGELQAARHYLDQACSMDSDFHQISQDDPDLQPIV